MDPRQTIEYAYSHDPKSQAKTYLRRGLCGIFFLDESPEGMFLVGSDQDLEHKQDDEPLEIPHFLEQVYILSPYGLYYARERLWPISRADLVFGSNNEEILEICWKLFTGSKWPHWEDLRTVYIHEQDMLSKVIGHRPELENQLFFVDGPGAEPVLLEKFQGNWLDDFDIAVQTTVHSQERRVLSEEQLQKIEKIKEAIDFEELAEAISQSPEGHQMKMQIKSSIACNRYHWFSKILSPQPVQIQAAFLNISLGLFNKERKTHYNSIFRERSEAFVETFKVGRVMGGGKV